MSRAKKDSMMNLDKNWIKKSTNPDNKGKLRETLGTKEGYNIPEKKLEKAAHSKNPLTKKRAIFAETLRMFKKK